MIIVNEDYSIDVEKNCYTVKFNKHKPNKKGEETFETVGYFTSLSGAIKGVVKSMNTKKLSEGVHTLEQAIKTIQDSNERFEKLLAKVVSENE